MVQTATRILKSEDVEMEGRFHLDLGHSAPSSQNSRNSPLGTTKVNLLENHNDFALIELTCSCGRKTVIRCEYGNAAAGKTSQPRPDLNRKT